jgi:hypothetical protein
VYQERNLAMSTRWVIMGTIGSLHLIFRSRELGPGALARGDGLDKGHTFEERLFVW